MENESLIKCGNRIGEKRVNGGVLYIYLFEESAELSEQLWPRKHAKAPPERFSHLTVAFKGEGEPTKHIAKFRFVEQDYSAATTEFGVYTLHKCDHNAPYAGISADALFEGLDKGTPHVKPGILIAVDEPEHEKYLPLFKEYPELVDATTQLILYTFNKMHNAGKSAEEATPVYLAFTFSDLLNAFPCNQGTSMERRDRWEAQQLIARRLTACRYKPLAFAGESWGTIPEELNLILYTQYAAAKKPRTRIARK